MTRVFMIMGTALLLLGCGGTVPSYYVLTAEGPVPSGGGRSIGVGPVTLAEYVDRENLVIQSGPNQLQIAESHLWAGDLDNAVARVTSINLGHQLRTGNVQIYPWQRDSEIDYQVTMDIREFHAGNDGFAHIEAGWRVYALPGRQLRASRTFVGSEPITAEDYPSVVAAQSRLLAKLAADIAAGIKGR